MTSTSTSTSDGLVRRSSALAVATALSRATGFVRTSVWATALGLYLVGSAFTVANTLPAILFTLLAGGAISAVFVPQLVRATAESPEAGAAYADRLLTVTVVVLAPLTVLAVLAAPALARLYAGDGWTTQDLALAAAFTAWCVPQVLFHGLFAILSQVLHARGRPGPMMWAPVANNVVSIAVGAAFLLVGGIETGAVPDAAASVSAAEIAVLGGGATLGVIVQVVVLLPALRAIGFRYRPRLDLRGSGLGRSARLAGWTLVFVAAGQVAFAVSARVANTAGKAAESGFSWAAGLPSYTNAYMIMLVPHAVVAVSLAAAQFPAMSRAAVDGRPAEVGASVERSLLLSARVLVPAAFATATLGPLVTGVVFFGNPPADTWYMGLVLAAFAPAIVLYSAQFLVARGLYAVEDTRTPALIQLFMTVVQISGALLAGALLPPGWVVVGLALGFSLSYGFGLVMSVVAVRRRTGGLRSRVVVVGSLRPAMAALPAAIAAFAAMRLLAPHPASSDPKTTLVALAVSATLFAAVHLALSRVEPRRR
ncbi:lipid II flippase MurJ [Lentzea sp. BCCO 10_0798]|uniref:Lipid II flippase MurJ n=1 Tax=Lentzea kristufekii TaxID=3095430 RepID=A0ABU4TJN1_9PSEU|nr:lipid II flippase MurJ [Lentzea sp. BCCO 10_0798]MDX8048476.1 lipid II flippase MurJ [Lentzea sp. BCCO 10_0798]